MFGESYLATEDRVWSMRDASQFYFNRIKNVNKNVDKAKNGQIEQTVKHSMMA